MEAIGRAMKLLFILSYFCLWDIGSALGSSELFNDETSILSIMGDLKANPWESDLRLSSSVYPLSYDLFTHPDLSTSENQTFSGRVTIRVDSTLDRDYFQLHQKDLVITNSAVQQVMSDGSKVPVLVTDAFGYDPDVSQFWIIQTENVTAGTFEISMDFTGQLTGKIVGFYYSQYLNGNNESIPLATTKFEPTYARQAFPCFDEPSFRSQFNVSLVRPSDNGYIGLSNMPVMNEIPDSPSTGLTTTVFESSVNMVTYLACFIVSDFQSIETTIARADGQIFPFSVYAPAEKLYGMTYSMGIGVSTLLFYEEMFNILFPLPKCDMAAIPDYSSGATEHWGIITYRETNLFYSKDVSSESNKQRVASVVCHEMAHQWFGNLVTLKWWDDLWLNEAFATYVSYKGVAHSEQTWDFENQFLYDELQYVFDIDSLLSSHPIVPDANDVETPDNITALFDSISYSKGASVLRMLEDFMGDSFQVGINSFLLKYSFANAETQDLYDELTLAWQDSVPEGVDPDIGAIMDTWTLQMGYPAVTAVQSGDTLNFSQNRFLQNPQSTEPSLPPYFYKWTIPIRVMTSIDPTPKLYWFNHTSNVLTIPFDSSAEWFKVNVDQVGYYRVNYQDSMWNKLATLCPDKTLGTADRSSLYNDVLSLADGDIVNYAIALNFTESLLYEDEYVPWSSARGKLINMDYLLLSTNVSVSFKEYVRELVTPTYLRLNWTNLETDTHLDSLLRPKMVDLTCRTNQESCLDEAGCLLEAWINDETNTPPQDTKRYVYWWGLIRQTDENTWNTMWDRCMAETVASVRSDLYYGLANSQDEATLNRYIELAWDENNVRSQDFLNVLAYISFNPVGMDLVWLWVQTNWTQLVDRYTLESRYLGQLIPDITQYFATEEKLQEMKDFFALYPEAGAGEIYRAQAIEKVEFNIYWVENYSPVIGTWLSDRASKNFVDV